MSANQDLYRVIWWIGDRVVNVSEPMLRDEALGLFNECAASGRYTPTEPGRVAVVAEKEYAKRERRSVA